MIPESLSFIRVSAASPQPLGTAAVDATSDPFSSAIGRCFDQVNTPLARDDGSGMMPIGYDYGVLDEYVVPRQRGRRLSGFFVTLNGKTMWHLMRMFEETAFVTEAGVVLENKGYTDEVLMKKMITWVSAKKQKPAILGDIYITGKGIIYAYTGKKTGDADTGDDPWVSVGRLKLNEDGSIPFRDSNIIMSNRPNAMKPDAPSPGTFWVSTFDGDTPGLYAYEFSGVTWIDRTDRFEFDKHIEIGIRQFPNADAETGSQTPPSFGYVKEASSEYTTTAYTDIGSLWGTVFARYTRSITNGYTVTIDESDDPTSFVMDANALLAGSPVRANSFDGSFSFLMLNNGQPLGCEYTMTSYETGAPAWSFYSGTPCPAEEYQFGVGTVTHYPPDPPRADETRTRSGRFESFVPVVTIRTGASSSLVYDPDTNEEKRVYRFSIPSGAIVPYMSKNENYTIEGRWLNPVISFPGASRTYFFPATVRRRYYGTDSQYNRLFDTEHREYATDVGGIDLMKITFPTSEGSWSMYDYCDDGQTMFPHDFVVNPDNVYHCLDISAGVYIKFAATSGAGNTFVSF